MDLREHPAENERYFGKFYVHFKSCDGDGNLLEYEYEFVRLIQILNGETVPVRICIECTNSYYRLKNKNNVRALQDLPRYPYGSFTISWVLSQ